MRRVYIGRPELSARLELRKRQRNVKSTDEARDAWSSYRRSAKARSIVQLLKNAAGIRMRCFYCSDSAAADVDHFKPLSVDFTNTFNWRNFIWVCPVCNRHKSNRFPCDTVTGLPLIVNPTEEDPWVYFILDIDTGVLAPRYRVDDFDVKGSATLDVLKPINHEAAAEGRKRVADRIREAAERIPDNTSAEDDMNEAIKRLLKEVREDDYGVAAWFGVWDGKSEQEFEELKTRNPVAWRRFVQSCVKMRYARNPL